MVGQVKPVVGPLKQLAISRKAHGKGLSMPFSATFPQKYTHTCTCAYRIFKLLFERDLGEGTQKERESPILSALLRLRQLFMWSD
jgi:hypothetical protein